MPHLEKAFGAPNVSLPMGKLYLGTMKLPARTGLPPERGSWEKLLPTEDLPATASEFIADSHAYNRGNV
jgi:hypothetical protein